MKCLIGIKLIEELDKHPYHAWISIDNLCLMVRKKKLIETMPFKDFSKIETGRTFLVRGEYYIKREPVLCVAGKPLGTLSEYTLEIAKGGSVNIDGEQYKLAIRDVVAYLDMLWEGVIDGSYS